MEPCSHIAPLTVFIQSVAFSVRVPTLQDRQWLAENFQSKPAQLQSPNSTGLGDASEVIEVSLVRDKQLARALLADKHSFDDLVHFFNMHGHSAGTRASRQHPNTVFDEELCVFYQVRSYRNVAVIAQEGQPAARVALLRVIREIASQLLLLQLHLPFHAAAVARGPHGILIIGERRAGKTTLLLHLLTAQKCDFVSNDRVFLANQVGQELRVLGMPGIVNIRSGCFGFVGAPGLERDDSSKAGNWPQAEDWHVAAWRARWTLEECHALAASHDASHEDKALSLSPCQFLHLARRELVPSVTANLLVFPQITSGNSARWMELSPQQVRSRLIENIFPFSESKLSPGWALGFEEQLQHQVQQQVESISNTTLGVELSLESGKPIRSDLVEAMLTSLL